MEQLKFLLIVAAVVMQPLTAVPNSATRVEPEMLDRRDEGHAMMAIVDKRDEFPQPVHTAADALTGMALKSHRHQFVFTTEHEAIDKQTEKAGSADARDHQVVDAVLQRSISTPRSEPNPPSRLTYEPQMVSIPGGTYLMGSPVSEKGRLPNERQHAVSIRDFQLSKYETTFDEYDAFARDTGRGLPSDNGWGRGSRPVINVSLRDASLYAKWLRKKTGRRYRLPTEAEWEYAARAGSAGAYSGYRGDITGSNMANCDGCGSRWDGKQTAPVGQFAANGWGLHDMAGNVWEWTCSSYSAVYDGEETRCISADRDNDHSLRGGSWISDPLSTRAASRKRYWLIYADLSIGFRLALDM